MKEEQEQEDEDDEEEAILHIDRTCHLPLFHFSVILPDQSPSSFDVLPPSVIPFFDRLSGMRRSQVHLVLCLNCDVLHDQRGHFGSLGLGNNLIH
jgi:hypothetical protein